MNPLFKGMVALLVSTSFWPTSAAHSAATNPDTGPGCGLGRQLWEDWKGKKQIAPQLFMASTNVTGSYTFAITSGTSGCSNDGTIWDSQKAGLFMEINYANVMDDMARGGGEHLASLAALLGVTQEEEATFFSFVQRTGPPPTHGEPALLLEWLRILRRDMAQQRLMAQGSGEHLASRASLMGVSGDKQPDFFAMTQEHHISLVNAGEASPVAMVKALNDAAASYPASTTVASK